MVGLPHADRPLEHARPLQGNGCTRTKWSAERTSGFPGGGIFTMRSTRRSKMCLLVRVVAAAGVLGGLWVGGGFTAVAAPSSLRIMAPAAPGGGWDQTARAMQAVLTEQRIIPGSVEVFNVPGAGGTVGLARLVSTERGRGDLLMVTGAVMVGAILTNRSPVSLAQTTPIARLTGEYEVIVVPANSPFRTLGELLEAFRRNPGSISWGGGSAGGIDHILAGLVAKAVGLSARQVNYIPFSGGGEALASVLGGHVSAGISGYGEWRAQIEAGQLRALGITSGTRLAGVNIPTLVEQGLPIELANWRGLVAPPAISPAERQALVDAVTAAVQTAQWQQTLVRYSWTDYFLAGDAFARFVADEADRVRDVLVDIGLIAP